MRTVTLITLLAAVGLLLSSPLASQDSRPAGKKDTPPTKDAPKDAGAAAKGKNPLDDPQWKLKAKLGKSIAKKRCVICHKIDGKGGVLSPPMEEVTAKRFEDMLKYDAYVKNLKAKDPARYRVSKKKIDAIVAEGDRYQKLILWLKAYLKKPTFDNGKAKMTPQTLKKEELENVIAYLLTLEPKKKE